MELNNMAFTREEKEYVIEVLDQMDRQKLNRILASSYSFAEWLSNACRWIFQKVAEWELHLLFDKIMNFFFNR
jgi:6-pyruvoyl-tetrahydropterin synthase